MMETMTSRTMAAITIPTNFTILGQRSLTSGQPTWTWEWFPITSLKEPQAKLWERGVL